MRAVRAAVALLLFGNASARRLFAVGTVHFGPGYAAVAQPRAVKAPGLQVLVPAASVQPPTARATLGSGPWSAAGGVALAGSAAAAAAVRRASPALRRPRGREVRALEAGEAADTAVVVDADRGGGSTAPSDILIDFRAPEAAAAWVAVDDRIMGGSSLSRVVPREGCTSFEGSLIVDGGGFASARFAGQVQIREGVEALVLEARGDGRRGYKLTLSSAAAPEGVSYQYPLELVDDAGEFRALVLPLAEFRASCRGRPVPDAPRLRASDVRGVGLMLSRYEAGGAKQAISAGSFRLDLRYLAIASEAQTPSADSSEAHTPTAGSSEAQAPSAEPPPVGLHLGVICDKTMNPIAGYRYTRIGSRPSYDLCQAEFDKLPSAERAQFRRLAPPVTPRRALLALSLFSGAFAALSGVSRSVLAPQNLFYDDYIEVPQLSPAESLVGAIFRPRIPATQREAGRQPAAQPAARLLVPEAAAAECDEACKQRIADRRALFEQSRTTSDRQKILDLSKQRAALYNTTFRGASCIKGLPCW